MRPEIWIVGENVPDVRECYGHPAPSHLDDPDVLADPPEGLWSCPQCDGRHVHDWVSCATMSGRVPVRCHVCGARKCDVEECIERRHHRSPHQSREHILHPVGG